MPQVEITAMTFGPFGVGRLDGKTIMVPHCAPGDVVEIGIESERRDYAIARLGRVIRPGPARRIPPCPFLPRCGGCDWQQIDYAEQIKLKAELIALELGRALQVSLDTAELVEPAPAEFGYRSRIRLQTARGGKLGFYELGSNRLVEVDRCMVAAEGIRIPFLFASAIGGDGRAEIEVAKAGEREVLIGHLARAPKTSEMSAARALVEEDTKIAGIVIRGGRVREVIGDAAIGIEIEPGLDIRVDADLFSQVNHEQNRRLVSFVMNIANARDGVRVLDLYCGAGNFSIPAARRGSDVMGVDADELAIAGAESNAKRLGLERARFVAMKAAETAEFLARARYKADVVILDPPRSGAAEMIEPIGKLRPLAIIYVSCNLATLARDLRAIVARGYRLERVRAFDFFPNTHHAEVVAHAVLT